LDVSLSARKLDVEASPYDVTAYGGGVVPVETEEGRKLYRERQMELMESAEPVRRRLLDAYQVFMQLSFDEKLLKGHFSRQVSTIDSIGKPYAAPERFARAEPGGLPWRKNIIGT